MSKEGHAKGQEQEAAALLLGRSCQAGQDDQERSQEAQRSRKGVQASANPQASKKALNNHAWQEGTKWCFGPLHGPQGALLPCLPNDPEQSAFWFYKPGTARAGKPFPRCIDCERLRRGRPPGTSGFVPVGEARERALWLADRIGRAETCRRLGFSANFFMRLERDENKLMRKATHNAILSLAAEVAKHQETRHPNDIAHGTKQRGKVEWRRRWLKHEQNRTYEAYLAAKNPVDETPPDKFWWIDTGMGWLPRWGAEMLGDDF